MKSNLLFEFNVNKEDNTVFVKREFDGPLSTVWDAWTKPEILDLWWAPKPYKAVTKSMDFREGGRWLYYMLSPQNDKHWCKNDYRKIVDKDYFIGLDAFCDEHGKTNENMPRTEWKNTFSEEDNKTLVTIQATYPSLADLEKVIKMGFREGFTMALSNLDEVLNDLNRTK